MDGDEPSIADLASEVSEAEKESDIFDGGVKLGLDDFDGEPELDKVNKKEDKGKKRKIAALDDDEDDEEEDEDDLEDDDDEEDEQDDEERGKIKKKAKKDEEEDDEYDFENEEDEIPKEELKKLPRHVQGIYWRFQKEKDKRKNIEGELDHVKLQMKLLADKKGEKEPDEKEEDPVKEEEKNFLDFVNEIDPEKPIYGSEVKDIIQKTMEFTSSKIMAQMSQQTKKQKADIEKQNQAVELELKKVRQAEKYFADKHTDYQDRFALAMEVIEKDRDGYQKKIDELHAEGTPLHEWIYYDIAPLHSGFEDLKQKHTKKKKKSGKTERIINNSKKKKTLADLDGGGVRSNEDLAIMDPDDLANYLVTLPPSKIGRIPKKIRDRALM